MDWWETVWDTIAGQGMMQWAAFTSSIIYVWLAAKENIWCWFFGLIGVILYFFIFIEVGLFSDACLQVFYALMSVYGWVIWRKGLTEGKERKISKWQIRYHLLALGIGIIIALGLGLFWDSMGAALPYIDAFTTSFSIIATLMVAWKILENWIYWIIIDLVCIGVYIHREIYLTSILFFIYCVIACLGWMKWNQRFHSADDTNGISPEKPND